jgi:hypothetical protein
VLYRAGDVIFLQGPDSETLVTASGSGAVVERFLSRVLPTGQDCWFGGRAVASPPQVRADRGRCAQLERVVGSTSWPKIRWTTYPMTPATKS